MQGDRLLHFIHTPDFDDCLIDIPMSDEELREVQQGLQANPEAGSVIRGTGGVRKSRAGAKGRGKSGGARLLYYYVIEHEVIYLLLAYDKSETDNISESGRKVLRRMAAQLDSETK
jgi:hypothetical protein